MNCRLLIVCGLIITTGSAWADSIPKPGDYYLISRDHQGEFRGSHKIFKRQAKGLHSVQYCGRNYWVRPLTVAWSQLEVENAREVRVEFNRSRGWRPICEHPETQITLKDLGIDREARAYLLNPDGETEDPLALRFNAIGNAFR